MFEDLNRRLQQCKEKMKKESRYRRELEALEKEKNEKSQVAERLAERLKMEKQDVEKLTGMGITNLFYSFLGKKEEMLRKEQKEVVEAALKYDEATATLKDISDEMTELEQQASSLRHPRNEYAQIIKEKEVLIHDQSSPMSDKLFDIAELKADALAYLKEIQEAKRAGVAARQSLWSAKNKLESAGNWGTWDMFGGGMISTAMKHSRIDEAQGWIHDAQRKLRKLQKELSDLEMNLHVQFETGGMLKFADFFFDGLIVDWMVQGKINDSLGQVNQQAGKVSKIISELESQEERMQEQIKTLEKQYEDTILSA